MKKIVMLFGCLLVLLSSSGVAVAQTGADVGKVSPPVQVKTAPTSMRLSASEGKVYLDVKPSPAKLNFYTGKRRLGSMAGNRQTRFDVTTFASKAEKGQLRVVASDKYGKQRSSTLNVSRYLAKTPAEIPSKSQQQKQLSKGAGQYEVIKPSFKKDSSHSADFDSSSKTAREISKPRAAYPTTSKPGAQADIQASAKVSDLLNEIERANSLIALQSAVRGLTLSKRETDQLSAALKDRQYLSKLESIARREVAKKNTLSGKKMTATKTAARTTTAGKVHQSSGTVSPEHKKQLKKMRKDIAVQKNRIIENRSHALTARTGAEIVVPGSIPNDRMRAPTEGSTGWQINSVTPSRAQIGRNVTITGSGFGGPCTHSGACRVMLLFDGSTRRTSMVHFNTIVSWSDNRIVATIPDEAAGIVGDRIVNARIWVKVPGGETGPLHDITLLPDFELLPPRIVHIAPTAIQPRLPLLIQGENFLSQRPGEVFLRFAGKEFPTVITSWDDDLIEVEVPPIIRLLNTNGSVIVRNHAGYEATAVASFSPTIYQNEYEGPGNHGSTTDTRIRVQCLPRFGRMNYSNGDDPIWLLCVFGDKKKSHVHFNLHNGWTVKGGYIELLFGNGWQGRHDCGAYYEKEPIEGSNRINTERVVWTNPFSECTFRDIYPIEGPAGVSAFEDNYNPSLACINTGNRHDLDHLRDHPTSCSW